MKIRWSAVRKVVLVAVFLQECALHGCTRAAPVAPDRESPIVLISSADFGFIQSGSGIVSRLVKIRNSSHVAVHIARWTVSCECLSIEPSSVVVPAEDSTYVRLEFNPVKESDNFVGNLCISVEAFASDGKVCSFDVPVSVIARENLKHLDKRNEY